MFKFFFQVEFHSLYQGKFFGFDTSKVIYAFYGNVGINKALDQIFVFDLKSNFRRKNILISSANPQKGMDQVVILITSMGFLLEARQFTGLLVICGLIIHQRMNGRK